MVTSAKAWGIIPAARTWTAGKAALEGVITNENCPSECDGGSVRIFVLFVAVCVAGGQEGAMLRKRFTNLDVIEMAKLGLSDDVIIAKIRQAYEAGTDAVSFDTSVDGLKSLKAANVPDSVIKVMINPAPPPAPVMAGASPISVDPNLPPPEVGVYWRDQGKFVRVQGQAVTNTKTGGKAGSLFSNGLRNQHWDATIEGHTSKNVVRDRQPIFYLYVPDGDDSSDYVLIKLNKQKRSPGIPDRFLRRHYGRQVRRAKGQGNPIPRRTRRDQDVQNHVTGRRLEAGGIRVLHGHGPEQYDGGRTRRQQVGRIGVREGLGFHDSGVNLELNARE